MAESNSCRLCFSAKREYINISENSASGLNVAQTINKYVQVEAVDEDLLPKIVCVSCWKIIESFHCFHEMLISARKYFLTKVLQRGIKENNEGKFNNKKVSADSLMVIDKKLTIGGNFSQSSQTEQNRNISSFLCDICEMTFDNKILIRRHIIKMHVKTIKRKGAFKKSVRQNNSIHIQQYTQSLKDEPVLQNTDNNDLPDYFDKTCDMCSTIFESLNQSREHYLKQHKIAKGYIKCCGIKLKEAYLIKEHINWHLNPNIFRCDICEVSFKWKAGLREHNVKHDNRFACKTCNTSFSNQNKLALHVERKHEKPKQKYKCDLCDAKYKNKDTWKRHRLEVHDIVDAVEKPLKAIEKITIPDYFDMSCDECPTIMKSFKHAKSHYLEEHKIAEGYVKCCGKKFKLVFEIHDHIKLHQNPNIFRCNICEISFSSKARLNEHNIRHKRELVCDICGKIFAKSSQLKRHRQTHDPKDEKYKCPTCHKTFSSQLLLNIHLETHKEKPTEKEEICEYCAKRFSYKHGLQKHIQTVHLKKPQKPKEKVQCVVCGGWYAEKKYLERHMITHNSEPVKCDLCETTLANKRSFDSHNRMFHKNGGLNFECHLCSKKFRIKSDLQDHIGVHTNDKKHKCSYCDVAFIWKTEMYKHQKRNHFELWSVDKAKKLAARTQK